MYVSQIMQAFHHFLCLGPVARGSGPFTRNRILFKSIKRTVFDIWYIFFMLFGEPDVTYKHLQNHTSLLIVVIYHYAIIGCECYKMMLLLNLYFRELYLIKSNDNLIYLSEPILGYPFIFQMELFPTPQHKNKVTLHIIQFI